jgi:hypothetical protein
MSGVGFPWVLFSGLVRIIFQGLLRWEPESSPTKSAGTGRKRSRDAIVSGQEPKKPSVPGDKAGSKLVRHLTAFACSSPQNSAAKRTQLALRVQADHPSRASRLSA